MKYLISIIILALVILGIIFGLRGLGKKDRSDTQQDENVSATVTARAPDGTEIVATVEEPEIPLAVNAVGENNPETDLSDPTGDTVVTSFAINNSESSADWSGSKIGTTHTGSIGVSGGTFTFNEEAGSIAGGSINFDTTKITVTDLEGEGADSLRGHLEGEDFFNIAEYPTLTFVVMNHNVADQLLTGDLTIRGVTESIDVPVTIDQKDDTIIISGEASVDRTLYGMTFGSIKFFPEVADAAVSDTFTLTFDVTAVK